MDRYFLTGSLSVSITDDPDAGRRCCIFVGPRVFYGSERMAQLLGALDGQSTLAQLADRLNVGAAVPIDAAAMRAVIETHLIPAGLVAAGALTCAPAPRSSYLFFARTLLSAETVGRASVPLVGLLHPRTACVLLAACAGLFGYWVATLLGGASWRAALADFDMTLPEASLFYALLFACFLLHELGHAAAARRGGSVPAEIGVGLYLVFPVLFCNVTDAWRLPRGARVLVNLGGVYFQLLATALLIPIQLATHSDVLNLLISANLISMAVTLNPFFRFDGYWIYSDLFRIPNLRDQARACTGRLLARAARAALRLAPTPSSAARDPRALRAYAVSSLLFFSAFAAITVQASWKLAHSVPPMLALASIKFANAPLLEAYADVGGSVLMMVLYLAGCSLSLMFVASSTWRGAQLMLGAAMPRGGGK